MNEGNPSSFPKSDLKVLILEDAPTDAELIARALSDAGIFFVLRRVDTEEAFLKGLTEFCPDLILADYQLPAFDGLSALSIVKSKHPGIPFIFVTGAMGEELAIEIMRRGATDYVLKSKLAKLAPAVVRALKEAADAKERILTLERLRESEEKYRLHFENVNDLIFSMDKDLRVLNISPSVERLLGYLPEEIIGKTIYDLGVLTPFSLGKASSELRRVLTGERLEGILYRYRTKEGIKRYAEASAAPLFRDGQVVAFVCVSRDVTERRQAETELQESENKLRAIFNTVGTGILIIDAETQIIQEANHHAEKITGRSKDELIGKACRSVVCPAPECRCPVKDLGQSVDDSERKLIYADGTLRDILKTVYPIKLRGRDCYVESFIDITERKRTEQALKESEEKYRGILENMDEAYAEIDLSGNFTFFNDAQCRHLGYSRKELMGMNYKQYVDRTVIRKLFSQFVALYNTGQPIKAVDMVFTQKDGTKGFSETSIALVRDKDGKPVGFRGLSRNTTERKKHEEELQRTLASLRRAVGTTIQVMVSALEARDPYTAGHQLRSADLARAIGAEMGLPPEQLDGIRMASSIHDIGKIAVPSEILTKPTRLSDIEFALMKEHARRGFEILDKVESPWPLAEIAYQHHERLNGTGYPRQLRGDEILIEARILGVADVVESMASHRPYRPALGLDVALGEIVANKGILYDPAAVDACMKLFQEKNYRLLMAEQNVAYDAHQGHPSSPAGS